MPEVSEKVQAAANQSIAKLGMSRAIIEAAMPAFMKAEPGKNTPLLTYREDGVGSQLDLCVLDMADLADGFQFTMGQFGDTPQPWNNVHVGNIYGLRGPLLNIKNLTNVLMFEFLQVFRRNTYGFSMNFRDCERQPWVAQLEGRGFLSRGQSSILGFRNPMEGRATEQYVFHVLHLGTLFALSRISNQTLSRVNLPVLETVGDSLAQIRNIDQLNLLTQSISQDIVERLMVEA